MKGLLQLLNMNPKLDRVSKDDILSGNKVISGLSATAWLLYIIHRPLIQTTNKEFYTTNKEFVK